MSSTFRQTTFPSPIFLVAALFVILVLPGCATLTDLMPGKPIVDVNALRQELEARAVGQLDVGPEVALANVLMDRLASTVDGWGIVHLAGIDAKKQVHHIMVDMAGATHDDLIGSLPSEADAKKVAFDIVEYPAGTIRIAAGDIEYARPTAGGEWSRTGGNRCRQYLVRSPSLFCAFVITGEEAGTQPRTDVKLGIIIILPVVLPTTVRPGKLVLAERVDSAWVVRAVLDRAGDWSADESEFTTAVDQQGTIHVIFCAWRGGGAFAVVASPYSMGGGSTGPKTELRYARFVLPVEGGRSGSQTEWQEVRSERIPAITGVYFREKLGETAPSVISPLPLRISIAPRSGVAIDLLEANSLGLSVLQGGEWREMPGKNLSIEHPSGWATSGILGEPLEFLAVDGFPRNRSYHYKDSTALLRIGSDDERHILVDSCSTGWWRGECKMVYVRREQNGKLATTVLPSKPVFWRARALVIGNGGAVFAAWAEEKDQLVGRWIKRGSPPMGAPQL